jgi:hypothetical protein
MFGMPIRLEIRVDLAINQKNTGRPFPNPGPYCIEVSKSPHSRGSCAVAAGDRREIRLWKLNDIDRLALPEKVVHFGGV